MKKILTISAVFIAFISCKETTKNTSEAAETTEVVAENTTAETDPFKSQLEQSPRHHEWVDIPRDSGSFKAFVVYPEVSEPVSSVLVIHENRGLNDWARSFADELASKGFLVITPDLISNTVPGKERTTDFETSDAAREALYKLDPEQVLKDLTAAANYIKADDASNGTLSVVGFCWGGAQSFRFATAYEDLQTAVVFYGTAPKDLTTLASIQAPVYGFYGGNDNRVNAGIPDAEKAMKEYGKTYTYEIYEGAGHAFMRRGAEADSDQANKDAHDKAWERLVEILPK